MDLESFSWWSSHWDRLTGRGTLSPVSLSLSCFFLFLIFCHAAQHVGSQFPNRDGTHAPCSGAQSLDHWPTREVPKLLLLRLYHVIRYHPPCPGRFPHLLSSLILHLTSLEGFFPPQEKIKSPWHRRAYFKPEDSTCGAWSTSIGLLYDPR